LITENVSTLKIHKLSKEQYEREYAAGRIDENAIYLTPDEAIDPATLELITTQDIMNICDIVIYFEICAIGYNAEEGMTWTEWVNSSYNTDGYAVSGNYITIPGGTYIGRQLASGETVVVKNTDIIKEAESYTTWQ
jgi:hypothetical protein